MVRFFKKGGNYLLFLTTSIKKMWLSGHIINIKYGDKPLKKLFLIPRRGKPKTKAKGIIQHKSISGISIAFFLLLVVLLAEQHFINSPTFKTLI